MVDVDTLLGELDEQADQGFLADHLLRTAVRSLAESDDRFSWVGVYLLNDEGDELWLHNYVGPHTDHGRIKVGVGVCGTAVAEGENQNVPDVTAIDNYLACSTTVKSELVVLIRAGTVIYGQIDIDSEEKAAFTEEDEVALQRIADRLAAQIESERG